MGTYLVLDPHTIHKKRPSALNCTPKLDTIFGGAVFYVLGLFA